MSNYDILIQKLDRFIRKYYLNRMIRGILYFIGLALAVFLLFTFLESQFYFEKAVRKVFFGSFLLVSLGTLAYWVLNPMIRYFRLGKLISHEQAASIIGDHFPNVRDKLLNVLQLKHNSDPGISMELLEASIQQKSDEIKVVPFRNAIDLRKNRKYLRFALPPLLILLAFLIASPTLITDSTNRILRNNESFEKPAPFHFVLDEENLEVVEYDDYELHVNTEGNVVPGEAFLLIGNQQFKLKSTAPGSFQYTFRNVDRSKFFSLRSGSIQSREYELSVLAKPQIVNFSVALDYPQYTGRKDEQIEDNGDLILPVGTRVLWQFQSKNAGNIDMHFGGMSENISADKRGADLYELEKQILKSQDYKVYISNADLPHADSVFYSLNVIPDKYPSISAERFVDSTSAEFVYFSGNASDDYGIRRITFNYELKSESGDLVRTGSTLLKTPGANTANFDYLLSIDTFQLSPGDELLYFFEAWDNDRINGSKSSRTSMMTYRKPTAEEYARENQENSEQIKENLEESIEKSRELKEEIKKLREKILSKKELGWEDKKELEKLLEKQQELQKQLEEAMEKFKENQKNQEEFSNPSEEMQEKQEKLEDLFEEVVDDEMQELMEKIQELLEELDRENALEMMEDFQMSEDEMEMEMDRLLELFKQLELEKEWQDQVDALEELSEEQEQLSKESEEGEKSSEELSEEQEEIQEKFEEISKEIDKLEEKNQDLERPKNLEDTGDEEQEINDEMNQSQQNLQQNQKKNASQNQKNASEKMKEMAQSMQSSMASMQMAQMQEDMKTLRQLLENLVNLSFDQEDLVTYFNRTSVFAPRYVDLVQDQFKIEDDFRMVEDSLQALSKRVTEIESFIIDKVQEINRNLDKGIDHLEERQKSQASDNQRRTMTGLNDLALMLSEVMQQMQQQMSSMMMGSQMCNNPQQGQGSKPMDKITQGQQQLNEEMKNMHEQIQQSKGKNQPGSKEFAQMAARQAALRKMLREMQEEKTEQGNASEELEKILEEMNKNETQLVNKQLTNEMIKRQKEILTKLLEAERAEREQDWDNKREAETAIAKERKLPPELEKYIKERNAEIDYYKTVSPNMKPMFRILVEEYYRSLKQ